MGQTMPLAGASPSEERLCTHLTGHVAEEQGLLVEYEDAVGATDSKAMAYLVNLLIEDEKRHHQLFLELAASLRNLTEGSGAQPLVPEMDFGRADKAALLPLIERLLARERQDEHELKQLRHELRDLRDTTLWSILVELMERDTAKHIALLRFARRHTKRDAR